MRYSSLELGDKKKIAKITGKFNARARSSYCCLVTALMMSTDVPIWLVGGAIMTNRFFLVTFTYLLAPDVFAGGYVVNDGRPELFNERIDSKSAAVGQKIVIRDPVMNKIDKKTITPKPKVRPTRVKRESIQSFRALAIKGRHAEPRVKFTLPELPVRRVDESFDIEVRDKILGSK